MFGLLGPNGAGKTTTIRMIMNITAPDSGEIRVLGAPMSRATQNRIGYLPEERGLYRKMKVLDHLYFLAAIKEVSKEKAKERIAEWIDKMELRPVAQQEGGRALQGDAAEGPVHRDDRARSGDPDPGRGLLRPRPDQHGAHQGLPDGVSRARQDDRLLDARPRAGREAVRRDLPARPLEEDPRGELEGPEEAVRRRPAADFRGRLGKRGPGPSRSRFRAAAQRRLCHRARPRNGPAGVLRRAFERYDVKAFSEKEPELEEIYLSAVRKAGLEETRIIE